MIEHINKFIDFMAEHGCEPEKSSDIRADDSWRDFHIKGDTSAKKKGYYTLKIDGDFVSGAFGDRRIGETHQYKGQPTRKLTDEERREYARKAEEAIEQRKAAKLRENIDAKHRAAKHWNAGKEADHQYLSDKGIDSKYSKVDGRGFLLVPMYYSGELWNVQSIDNEGQKLFKKGGRKLNTYCPLGEKGEDKSTLFICEGFATGKSIRGATNCLVIVAFDAGNLVEIAKDKREENPDSEIFICADNDETGITKAKIAAKETQARILCPPDEDMDFNDYAQVYGAEKLESLLDEQIKKGGAVKVEQEADDTSPDEAWLNEKPPVEAYSEEQAAEIKLYEEKETKPEQSNWREWLSRKKDGTIKPRSLSNLILILEHSPKFKDMFCYDEFSDQNKIIQCPPWENPKRFTPRTLADRDYTRLAAQLEQHGITMGMETVKKALYAVAEAKPRNPAIEYMTSLEWDGTPRLDTWLQYYMGCESDNAEYVSIIGRKFMVALVTRVMKRGCKFDHVLILEGGQGVGKSRSLRALATIHGKSYFTDSLKITDLGKAAAVSTLQGILICEFAEMTGLNKMDMDTFKQQITIQEDRIVKKYQNEPTDFPRQFVMVGSINPKEGYLDDPTGLRRFWPVTVGNEFKVDELAKDREQLYAEAMELYKQDYPIWLNKEEAGLLEIAQETRKMIAPWMPEIEDLVEGKEFVSQREIWESLNFEKSRRNQKDMSVIAKIMTELQFKQIRKKIGNKRITGWQRK